MSSAVKGLRSLSIAATLLLLAGCNAGQADQDTASAAAPVTEVVQAVATPAMAATPKPAAPVGPSTFLFDGELTQGGWLRGQAPTGTVTATLGDEALMLDNTGRFFAAFDRDAGTSATLRAVLADNTVVESPIAVSARSWNLERVNAARRSGGAGESFMRRRRPELAQIKAARQVDAHIKGWRQDFIWPVTGRISGRFGSQRIYRGEPGSYHSGIDIARSTGTPFVAPADGVVTLASDTPFSLEGYLLIIDHGNGLNSAFLHCSKIAVGVGDVVRQGEYVGDIGSTGRATGPHLHWGLKWRSARLDPLLFTGPMP